MLYFMLWRKKRFLVKASCFKKKLHSVVMHGLGCYPVEKGKDLSLIKYCTKMIDKDYAVIMFPEGMRVFDAEDALALRNGAAMIAIKAGVPIVPMVTKRTPRPFVYNALKVGTAISTEQYQGKKLEKSDLAELSGKIQASMSGLLEGWGHVPKQQWWEKEESVISRGVVLVEDSKLLAIRRVRDGQEYYVLPGGHIEEGESARDAAIREVLEETGVRAMPNRLLYKNKFNDRFESFYYCQYASGEIVKTETEEPVLLDLAELKDVDLRPNLVRDQIIKDIKKFGPRLVRPPIYVK